MELYIIIVLLVVLIMTMITIYYKLYNQYIRLYNNEQNRIDEYTSIKRDYKCIIDILEKHNNVLNHLLTCVTNYNQVVNEFKTSFISISNGILELHQEHNQVVSQTIKRDFSLHETIMTLNKDINTTVNAIRIIVDNTEQAVKSLEAKNSLCKCKSTKTSTKKKKEETQADNS